MHCYIFNFNGLQDHAQSLEHVIPVVLGHDGRSQSTEFSGGSTLDRSQRYRYSSLIVPPAEPTSDPHPLITDGSRTTASEALISPAHHHDHPASNLPQTWQVTHAHHNPILQSQIASQAYEARSLDPSELSRTLVVPPINGALSLPVNSVRQGLETLGSRSSQEKKHACWMCHKSFDRPSTLRKHLLVHTGEKAFACDTCGRRFGVASNLNRHRRRCILKPVNNNGTAAKNSSMFSGDTPAESPSRSPPASDSSSQRESTSAFPASNVRSGTGENNTGIRSKRTRKPTSADSSLDFVRSTNTLSASTNEDGKHPRGLKQSSAMPGRITETQNTAPKRRRRAPSPAQWVPGSLGALKLLSVVDDNIPSPVPLLPRYPSMVKTRWSEERNSWDQDVSIHPYRADGWKERLPGPGLGHERDLAGRDVANQISDARYIMGRVIL